MLDRLYARFIHIVMLNIIPSKSILTALEFVDLSARETFMHWLVLTLFLLDRIICDLNNMSPKKRRL